MLDQIIKLSILRRDVVLFAVLLVAGLGVWNFSRLTIDAVPDITNVQVVINTCTRLYAFRSRATRHLSSRECHGRYSTHDRNPFILPLRPVTDHRGI